MLRQNSKSENISLSPMFTHSQTQSQTQSQTNQPQTQTQTNQPQTQTQTNQPQLSLKEIFNTSKLYHKYLSSVKTKITNSNISDISDIKDFDEYYDNANTIYDEIKREWFWLSNGDKMRQFINKTDSVSMESHKENYYNNFQMLEVIAKMYGFDAWYSNLRNRLGEQTTNELQRSSTEEKTGQANI